MISDIQSFSLEALEGRVEGVINCCCFSGSMLYLGIDRQCMVTCEVHADGSVQPLSSLSIPMLQEINEFGPGRLLLVTGLFRYVSRVYVWDMRKRRLEFLLQKRPYYTTGFAKTFHEYILLGKFLDNRVEVYRRGRLISFFENEEKPYGLFVSDKSVFLNCKDNSGVNGVSVFSNDPHFSLIKTLEGQIFSVDGRYLITVVNPQFSNQGIKYNVFSPSLEMVGYFENCNTRISVSSLLPLGANKILVRVGYDLHVFGFKDNENGEMELLWKYKDEEGGDLDNLYWHGLYVLDSSDPKNYFCLEVFDEMVRTFRTHHGYIQFYS